VLRFDVPRSDIIVKCEVSFVHDLKKDIILVNGALRKSSPAATPSWKVVLWSCNRHGKRTADSA
jgi:hypothetical protein